MYTNIAVIGYEIDTINGGAKSVRLGFFDKDGVCQLEVPQVAGNLFPKDIRKGQSIKFCNEDAKLIAIKK